MPRIKRRRVRGHGSVYRKGRTWTVKWVEGGKTQYSHGYPSKDQAEQVRANLAVNLAAGRGGLVKPAKGSKKTLSVLVVDWLERRKATHRAAADDVYRWTNHLGPTLGSLHPDAVDIGILRKVIEKKLAEKLSPATVRLCIRLLSTFYTDLIEQGHATQNPARMLPKATKRLIRPTHDPRTTPFVEKRTDIIRIYRALPEPVDVAYAIGALAGLRTGEILGLAWEHVDLDKKRIHVQQSITGPLKDDESRIVPIVDGLARVLTVWREKNPDDARVVPPMRRGSRKHLNEHSTGKFLKLALKKLKLPPMTFYQATRHTFASHWVLNGNSIERLRDVMGHSTVLVTERYAHLKADLFQPKDLERADLDLSLAGARG